MEGDGAPTVSYNARGGLQQPQGKEASSAPVTLAVHPSNDRLLSQGPPKEFSERERPCNRASRVREAGRQMCILDWLQPASKPLTSTPKGQQQERKVRVDKARKTGARQPVDLVVPEAETHGDCESRSVHVEVESEAEDERPVTAHVLPSLHCSAPALDAELQSISLAILNKRRQACRLAHSNRIFSLPSAKLLPVQERGPGWRGAGSRVSAFTFALPLARTAPSSLSSLEGVEQQIAPGLRELHADISSSDVEESRLKGASGEGDAKLCLGVDCNMHEHPALLRLQARGAPQSSQSAHDNRRETGRVRMRPRVMADSDQPMCQPKSHLRHTTPVKRKSPLLLLPAERPSSCKRSPRTRKIRGVSPTQDDAEVLPERSSGARLIIGPVQLSAGATRPANLPVCFSADCDSD